MNMATPIIGPGESTKSLLTVYRADENPCFAPILRLRFQSEKTRAALLIATLAAIKSGLATWK
jgi:hypothetical protein